MRKRILLGVWSGVVLLSLPTGGAGRPAPEGWGEIFARFDSYGLPDITTAVYVNVLACWEPRVDDLLPEDWETSGNAWMLSEVRDDQTRPIRARVVANGSRTFVVASSRDDGGETEKRVGLLEPSVPPKEILASGRWQEGNPARDAQKGVEFLKSLKWEGEPYGHYRYPGKLFLLAHGLWKRDEPTNAAALLAELAMRAGGTEGVAREAMNLVADGEYGNLYEAFRVDAGWVAYRDGIRRLLKKYPEGWSAAPVMQMLLAKVEARIADPRPRPTTAVQMSEENLRQATDMVGIRVWRGGADIYDDQPVLWIAPSGWRDSVPPPLDAEMAIRVRGMEAVSFLLSLMEEDDVLANADRVEVSKAGPYRGRFQPEELEQVQTDPLRQAMIQTAFEEMDRPATRGEVARRLLRDLIPEWVVGGSHRRMTKVEFIRAVRNFQEKHLGASDEEWAVLTLPGRYSSFNNLAVGHLMEVARRRAVPELERVLLEEGWMVPDASESDLDSAQDNKANLLITYAAIRGEETRPLVEAYAAQARRQAEAFEVLCAEGKVPRKIERAEKREKRLREVADQLAQLPLGKPAADVEATSAAPPLLTAGHYDRTVLEAKLQAMPLADILGDVLAHAVSIPDPNNRLDMAHLVGRQAGKGPVAGLKATDCGAEWEELIADDRATSQRAGWVVSEHFLALNEQLFARANLPDVPRGRHDYDWKDRNAGERAARQLLKMHGVRGRDWLRARVRQRLAGVSEEELPIYPIGTAPDEGVIESLRNRFSAAPDRETVARLAEGLSLPERIALPELLRREPELNGRLMEMAGRVERVWIDGDLGAWNRKLMGWEGRDVSADLIEDLRRIAEARSAVGQSFGGKLVRRPEFGGYEVVAEASVPVPEYYQMQKATQRISGYAGLVCGPDVYGAARWRTAPPPGKENWWAVETSGPFEMRAFHEAAGRFFGDPMPASEEAFVVFQTQGEKK